MTIGEATLDRIKAVQAALARWEWIPQLLVRLFVGYLFFVTGWAKVGHLDAMAERFAGWGIPWPAFNAALSAYTELIGGALIVLGLATRLAAIPLAFNMLVAIVVVNMRNVAGLDEFVELSEPLYALAFLWLVFSGPGRVSLDHVVWSRLTRSASRRSARFDR
jgi:putative oxidoreductase